MKMKKNVGKLCVFDDDVGYDGLENFFPYNF